jgi:hypothetical protein
MQVNKVGRWKCPEFTLGFFALFAESFATLRLDLSYPGATKIKVLNRKGRKGFAKSAKDC